VGLAQDVENFINEKKLGPDALGMNWDEFQHVFSAKVVKSNRS
jgi:hypothetical protein